MYISIFYIVLSTSLCNIYAVENGDPAGALIVVCYKPAGAFIVVC